MKKNSILSNREKKEIHNDVSAAFSKAKAKQKRNITFISIITILLIFVFGVYIFLVNNPKTIFINGINSVNNYIGDFLEKTNYNVSKTKIELNYGDNLNIKLIQNNDERKIVGDVINNDTSKELKLLFDDNNLYSYVKDISDNYVLIDDAYVISNDELNSILKQINQDFISSLDGQKLNGKKTEIKINNKITKVYASTFQIKKDGDFYNILAKNLKNDKKLVNLYEQITGEDEFNKLVDSKINTLKSKMASDINITIYTKGIINSLVAIEIEDNDTYRFEKTDNGYNYYLNDEKNGLVTTENNSLNVKINDFNLRITIDKSNWNNIGKEKIMDDNLANLSKQYINSQIFTKKELVS